MKLTLTQNQTHWVVRTEDKREMPYAQKFVPIDVAREVLAEIWPNHQVDVDARISRNPFFINRVLVSQQWNLPHDWSILANLLAHPEMKTCSVCGNDAWYNDQCFNWQCSRCKARQGFSDEEFVKEVRRKRVSIPF